MTTNTNPLQQLKDIHLPSPISMWPQAPGWYILGGILLVLISLGIIFGLRKYFICRRRNNIRRQLKSIMLNYKKEPTQSFEALSQLVRRIALARFKREQVASLQGEAWLKFLDDMCDTQAFSAGVGRVLITAPYQKQANADMNVLNNLLEKLIKKTL